MGDPILEDLTDWVRVKALTDEEIDAAIADDPDCFSPTAEELADGLARALAERAKTVASR